MNKIVFFMFVYWFSVITWIVYAAYLLWWRK